MHDLQKLIQIQPENFQKINDLLGNPDNELINQLITVVNKYGGPKKINEDAAKAGSLDSLLSELERQKSPYLEKVVWLQQKRDEKAFISLHEYRKNILGSDFDQKEINHTNAVTMEISALQYFPWLIQQAKRALQKGELMPARYIRVRNMKEQVDDNADIVAIAAAMNIIGATYVETLDTKGTDGSNVHLGGPETITGYFGGIGQPNEYPIKWIDEYLHYYTKYGISQVLNINSGTILAAYFLNAMGINNEFKISVFMGNDNAFAILWTLMAARLFTRPDGKTSLVGFNLSNSVNNETIRQAAKIRKDLGLDEAVRFEHHITETYKSIVRQPYNRREELVELAKDVPNIAAKHEGGEPEVEASLQHPSDILDYFIPKADVLEKGLMESLENNYLHKHASVNKTADALTKAKIGIVVAKNLH